MSEQWLYQQEIQLALAEAIRRIKAGEVMSKNNKDSYPGWVRRSVRWEGKGWKVYLNDPYVLSSTAVQQASQALQAPGPLQQAITAHQTQVYPYTLPPPSSGSLTHSLGSMVRGQATGTFEAGAVKVALDQAQADDLSAWMDANEQAEAERKKLLDLKAGVEALRGDLLPRLAEAVEPAQAQEPVREESFPWALVIGVVVALVWIVGLLFFGTGGPK